MPTLTRRAFLKLSALTAGVLAWRVKFPARVSTPRYSLSFPLEFPLTFESVRRPVYLPLLPNDKRISP